MERNVLISIGKTLTVFLLIAEWFVNQSNHARSNYVHRIYHQAIVTEKKIHVRQQIAFANKDCGPHDQLICWFGEV